MKLRNLFLQRIFGAETATSGKELLLRVRNFNRWWLNICGLLEIYFRYKEGLEQIGLTQQDAAAGAALRIERFVQDIATTMKAVTKSPDIRSSKKRIDYEFELKRLFFLAPAITEALVLDTEGSSGASFPFSRCLSFPQERSFEISCLPAIKSGQILFRDRLFPR